MGLNMLFCLSITAPKNGWKIFLLMILISLLTSKLKWPLTLMKNTFLATCSEITFACLHLK